jgi:hypothetical protein
VGNGFYLSICQGKIPAVEIVIAIVVLVAEAERVIVADVVTLIETTIEAKNSFSKEAMGIPIAS